MPPKSPKKATDQPTLASFFGGKPTTPSPTKRRLDKGKGKAPAPDVIELLDSDDDEEGRGDARPAAAPSQVETDEQMARRLTVEEEQRMPGLNSTGSKRKFEQIELELASPSAGPSSSKARSDPQLSSGPSLAPVRNPFTKSGPGPTLSSHVAIIPELDTDPLLFQPEEVDVAGWPGGRVPYAFIVSAGFVPVSATRKRLAIVRILTK